MELPVTPEGEFYPQPFVGWKVFRILYPNQLIARTSFIASLNQPSFIWSAPDKKPAKGLKQDNDLAVCSTSVTGTWRKSEEGNWYHHARKKKPHASPDLECDCGWHCYNTAEDCWEDGSEENQPVKRVKWYRDAAFGVYNEGSKDSPYCDGILTLVWAWGDPCWVFDNTTRSTKMKIAAICRESLPSDHILQRHADNLDVPLLTVDEMKEYAECIGVPLGKVV